MARGAYPLATDMAFDVKPGTTRILLRANASSDTWAVCSVEIHMKSGTNLSTSVASASSGRSVRTGLGASNVTCTPEPRSSPRIDSLKVFTNALVAGEGAVGGIGKLRAADPNQYAAGLT